MGRRTYSAAAVLVVLLAALLAIQPWNETSAPAPSPRRSGRNNTVLFVTTEQHGSSNVHLATSFALLEHYPFVDVHFASFPAQAPRLDAISAAARKVNPEAREIRFHELPGRSLLEAGAAAGKLVADVPHRPGRRGVSEALEFMVTYLDLWTPEEHYNLYKAILDLLEEIDPAVTVLDLMFGPAFEAMAEAKRVQVNLTPNSLTHFTHHQKWLQGFWKYPALATGFSSPVPWRQLPENLYMHMRVVFSVLKITSPSSQKRQILEAKGIHKPLNFFDRYQPDVPWISPASSLVEISMPMEYLPPNVSLVGPMQLSSAPAAEQDPEMASWLAGRPTVLVNLGTVQRYTEASAAAMAGALAVVLDQAEGVQVLWKMKKHPERPFGDEYLAPLAGHIAAGRARVKSWIAADPPSLLETGDVVLYVNHGGANGYYEAIAAGVPQVVLPLWLDTYEYAAAAEHVGVGLWGSKKAAPDWTVEELSEAILTVLDGGPASVAMREKARSIGEVIRSAKPGRDAAAEIIVQLAGSGF